MAQSNYSRGRGNVPVFSPKCTIKTIWGLAKSQELALNEENLYSIIFRATGKDSMKLLDQAEINRVCMELSQMKDKLSGKPKPQRRTDVGGDLGTVAQRAKIYKLTGDLGWNDNNLRINGFVKRMFNVERLEWLNSFQCNKLIETLKKMVEREELKANEGGANHGTDNGKDA